MISASYRLHEIQDKREIDKPNRFGYLKKYCIFSFNFNPLYIPLFQKKIDNQPNIYSILEYSRHQIAIRLFYFRASPSLNMVKSNYWLFVHFLLYCSNIIIRSLRDDFSYPNILIVNFLSYFKPHLLKSDSIMLFPLAFDQRSSTILSSLVRRYIYNIIKLNKKVTHFGELIQQTRKKERVNYCFQYHLQRLKKNEGFRGILKRFYQIKQIQYDQDLPLKHFIFKEVRKLDKKIKKIMEDIKQSCSSNKQ